jgi:hypothetical protein
MLVEDGLSHLSARGKGLRRPVRPIAEASGTQEQIRSQVRQLKQ